MAMKASGVMTARPGTLRGTKRELRFRTRLRRCPEFRPRLELAGSRKAYALRLRPELSYWARSKPGNRAGSLATSRRHFACRFYKSGGEPLFPQHRRDLVEVPNARVHLHCLVEAVGVGRRVAAPAAFARNHRRQIEVEGLPDARLDAAIGGATADDDGVAPQHMQELGDARPVEGARPALEEDVILGPRCDFVGKAGVGRPFDSVGEWRHAGLR